MGRASSRRAIGYRLDARIWRAPSRQCAVPWVTRVRSPRIGGVGPLSVDQVARRAHPSSRAASQEVHPGGTAEDVDLEALFKSHGASCYGLARSILRDTELAQDAVQEAFFEHWRNRTFDATRSTHRTWLLMLTHRKAIDRVRHEQRRSHLPMDAAVDPASTGRGPEELAVASHMAPQVRAALNTLPRVQQEALALAYWGGYKQREIAAITQTPIGTVKTRMRNGMIALREALRDERD